jgi:hypothetical protein
MVKKKSRGHAPAPSAFTLQQLNATLQKKVRDLHARIGFLDQIIRQLEDDKEFYRSQIPHAQALEAIFDRHSRGPDGG